MPTERCCAVAHRPLATRAGWIAVVPGLALIAAPKCPLCLAAYLSLLGVSVGTAGALTPLLAPIGAGLVALGAFAWWRRRSRQAPSCEARAGAAATWGP
jgi:MYXO-CTERM domain-containing protein